MTGIPRAGLVSVVVASYNHAGFLDRRMKSLIDQTYEEIEILVIDDCSPDDSVAVLRKYESHPKVRLIVREQNGGWVAVSNQGVDLAAGEYVTFANCDDDCDPRMIERLVDALRSNPSAGLAFCRSLLVDEHDRLLGDDHADQEPAFRARASADTLITGAEMSRFLLGQCVVPNLSAALFRRDCFATVGYLTPEYRVVCDWDLFFRVVARYDVFYVAEALNRFRQHATTIRSSTKERTVYAEYLRLLLPQVAGLDLSRRQRWRGRSQVMDIWALHLIAPSLSGLRDLPFHLRIVAREDTLALAMLPGALVRRVLQVMGKLVRGRAPQGTPAPS